MTPALTIGEAGRALREGRCSAVELQRCAAARAAQWATPLGALASTAGAAAEAAAREADRTLAAGEGTPLTGIPVVVKDIIDVAGLPTHANSALTGDEPAGADADCVATLRRAGAVVMGKATTSEFAVGLPVATSRTPVPRNPWDLERSPAGSSSGTAVAVATGMALGGLGTDTGGSVRAPSAATGITGLKLTHGLLSMRGVIPLSPSLDTVGPMARTAVDCALLLQGLAPGYLGSDEVSSRESLRGVRLLLPRAWAFDDAAVDPGVVAAVTRALDVLGDLGAEVADAHLPHAALARDAYHVVMTSEAFALHRDMLARRWSDYGAGTRMTITRGALFDQQDYVTALRFREMFRTSVHDLLADGILVTPTLAHPAARISDLSARSRLRTANFTTPWSLLGIPALALPAGFTPEGLPASIQLIGPAGSERRLLEVGATFQAATGWHDRIPAAVA